MADYTTLAIVKDDIDIELATQDSVITRAIPGASRFIDRYCGREDNFFVADAVASARDYSGSGNSYQFIDPCIEITTVAVKDSVTDTTFTAWAATDYYTFAGDVRWPDFNSLPYNGIAVDVNGDYSVFTSGKFASLRGFRPTVPFGRALATVRVTAKWGYSATVPLDIQTACTMIVARWYKRLRGGMSDTIASGELGMMVFTLKQLDPDVAAILNRGRWRVPSGGLLAM